jgi:peptidyl-prolyl cis-trans isomerase C
MFWSQYFKRSLKRRVSSLIHLFIGSVLSICLLGSCGSGNVNDQIVARVGKVTLTRQELQEQMHWNGMRSDQESEFIDQWVSRELLFQEAKRLGLQDSKELEWELELIEKEHLIQKLLESKFAEEIEISQEEIQAFYETNQDQFRVEEDEIHLFHILVKTQQESEIAYQEIRAGKSFEEVARERSVDAFQSRGGDLGFIRRSDVIREVARIAFNLATDRVGRTQSSHGFHIMEVVKRRSRGSIKDLEDVKSEIVHRIRIVKERTVYKNLLMELQIRRNVYVALPKPEASETDTLDQNSTTQ